LPDEILRDVFELAVGNDPISSLEPWCCMAESMWKDMIYDWHLLEPYQQVQFQQRENYVLKKSLMLVCKRWSRVGIDFMYRAVQVSDLAHLRILCAVLDTNSRLGWWTKSIYLYKDARLGAAGFAKEEMGDCISSLIRHCPHTVTFMVDPMVGALVFPVVADAIRTHCSESLTCARWHLSNQSQGLLIPALHSLRNITMLHLQISHAPSQETMKTSSAIRPRLGVSFPLLEDFSLRGEILDILEEIPSWELPKLTRFTLDFANNVHDFPDVVEIITAIGMQLEVLNINSIPTLNVPHILSACPNLTTFCFNLDWQLEGCLANLPHKNIEHIGLHGLKHAFGVGYAASVAAVNPFEAIIMRRRNDNNFAALTKSNFPKLSAVRMLSPTILRDLNKEDGPSKGVCYERWERWWEQCAAQRVRLEDCAANLLGTLPDAGESDNEEEEEGEGEGQRQSSPLPTPSPYKEHSRLGEHYDESGFVWA